MTGCEHFFRIPVFATGHSEILQGLCWGILKAEEPWDEIGFRKAETVCWTRLR
jgi:hypothetical protein